MKEWIRIFYDEYLSLNLKDYSNIAIDFEIAKAFLAAAIAIAICGIFLDLRHRYTYALVKQLLRHDAVKEENAKTLSELGLGQNKMLKCALSRSGKISSVVARVGEVKLTYEEYERREKEFEKAKRSNPKIKESEFFGESVDFESARFYVREESMPTAIKIFHGADVSIVRMVLRTVLIIIVSIIAVFFMPSIFEWINGIIG